MPLLSLMLYSCSVFLKSWCVLIFLVVDGPESTIHGYRTQAIMNVERAMTLEYISLLFHLAM